MDKVGDRILYLRKNAKMTQKDVADATGLQRGNMSGYERNRILPGAEGIVNLAKLFNVSCDWLLTGNDFDPPIGYTYDDPRIKPVLRETSEEYGEKLLSNYRKSNYDLSDEECILIDCYRLLKRDQQQRFLGRIEGATDTF